MAASASVMLHARRSISAKARSAMTFGRSPPRTVPMLTVVPRAKSLSPCRAVILCARSELGLQAGMRGLTLHLELKRAGALARHHILSAGPCRLQDPDAVRAPRLCLD